MGAGLFLAGTDGESVDFLSKPAAGLGAVAFLGGVHTGVGILPWRLLGGGEDGPVVLCIFDD